MTAKTNKDIEAQLLALEAAVVVLLANDLCRKDQRQAAILHNGSSKWLQTLQPPPTADAQQKADHFEIKEGAIAVMDRVMLGAQAVAAEMRKRLPPIDD
ncbi:MAG: hypothetical protein HOP13_01425 [Alphaproteobacteria bacterium]|nr:hypothetical protein [Alphaproteobacteria bacterium]